VRSSWLPARIQSPQILQLSGIGPANLLRKHGIDVVVDAPEVGENLKDHYQARTIVRLRRPLSLNDQVRNPLQLASMGMQWLLRNSGPLTVGAGQVGGLARTRHARDSRADVLFNVMPLSVDKPGAPLHRFSGFTASACAMPAAVTRPRRDRRRRSARATAHRNELPFRAARSRCHRRWRSHAARHLCAARVSRFRRQRGPPGAALRTDRELLDFAREKGGTVFHAAGTCRMGCDERAVVDPALRVRGVARLRVIDASVMPEIVSTNTNAASVMIGERGAQHVLDGPDAVVSSTSRTSPRVRPDRHAFFT
jgi:choline dehydrogenase